MRELKTQNELLQRHRHLIADKENKSKQDQERLVFIDAVNSIVGKIDQKQREKDLQSKFETALGKYLDGKEGLSEEDKMHLKQAAKFEDLRILNIFTLIYAEDKDREKVFAYSMSRVSKMYKNVKAIFGEDRIVRRTMRKYHTRRIISWAREMLTKNAGTWKLREIVGGLESLERKISASSSKIDDLYRRVEDFGKYEKNRPKALDPKKLLHEELLEHDLIHKEYEKLVRQATKAMSGQAQDMIEVGKRLEVIRKGAGKGFLTKALSDLPHISDDSLRKLFPNAHDIGKLRKTLKGGDLIRAYTNKYVAHASAKKNRRIIDPELQKLSLQELEDSYRKIVAICKVLGDVLDVYFLAEIATPQFDQLENWNMPFVTKEDHLELYKYWESRREMFERWDRNK